MEDSAHYCFVPINISDVLCDPHGNHKVKTCDKLQTNKQIKREESRISPQEISKS